MAFRLAPTISRLLHRCHTSSPGAFYRFGGSTISTSRQLRCEGFDEGHEIMNEIIADLVDETNLPDTKSKTMMDMESREPILEVQAAHKFQDKGSIKRLNSGRDATFNGAHGIYKVILLGEVSRGPTVKTLRNGLTVTTFYVITGGMRNSRRPFQGETAVEYQNRSLCQWHRIAIYNDEVGDLARQNIEKGLVVYIEGNLETREYNDPLTGSLRKLYEVAIRRTGQLLVTMGQSGKDTIHAVDDVPDNKRFYSAHSF